MKILIEAGKKECYIPHSPNEDRNSFCTKNMAGKKHNVKELYDKLIDIYENGNWGPKAFTILQYPNCTHVVCPIVKI